MDLNDRPHSPDYCLRENYSFYTLCDICIKKKRRSTIASIVSTRSNDIETALSSDEPGPSIIKSTNSSVFPETVRSLKQIKNNRWSPMLVERPQFITNRYSSRKRFFGKRWNEITVP